MKRTKNISQERVEKTTTFFNSLLGKTLTTGELNRLSKEAGVAQGLIYRMVELKVGGVKKTSKGWYFAPATKSVNTRIQGKEQGMYVKGWNGFTPYTIRQVLEAQNDYNREIVERKKARISVSETPVVEAIIIEESVVETPVVETAEVNTEVALSKQQQIDELIDQVNWYSEINAELQENMKSLELENTELKNQLNMLNKRFDTLVSDHLKREGNLRQIIDGLRINKKVS